MKGKDRKGKKMPSKFKCTYIFFLEIVKKILWYLLRGGANIAITNRILFFKEFFLNKMDPYLGPALHTFNWENIASAIYIKWDKWEDDRKREKRKAISSLKKSADKQSKATNMFKAKITCQLGSRKVG